MALYESPQSLWTLTPSQCVMLEIAFPTSPLQLKVALVDIVKKKFIYFFGFLRVFEIYGLRHK